MPQTTIVFYKEEDGQVPVFTWLRALQRRDRRAYAACIARIYRLAAMGHELRHPETDYLRNDIYELRARRGRVRRASITRAKPARRRTTGTT